MWEDARAWAQWNGSFDMYPHLSGSSTPFSHSEFPFFRAHLREWLESNSCWMARILSSLSSLRAHQLTLCWLQLLMTVTSLFIDMARNIPFLTYFPFLTLLLSCFSSSWIPQGTSLELLAWWLQQPLFPEVTGEHLVHISHTLHVSIYSVSTTQSPRLLSRRICSFSRASVPHFK